MHHAMSAEAAGHHEVVDLGMAADHAVLIKGIDLVVPRPGVDELDVFETDDSFGQAGANDVIEQGGSADRLSV